MSGPRRYGLSKDSMAVEGGYLSDQGEAQVVRCLEE